MKAGDTVRFKDPNGSIGMIEKVTEDGRAHVFWHHGVDVQGEPIIFRSVLVLEYLEPVGELFFKEFSKMRAWSDEQHAFRRAYMKTPDEQLAQDERLVPRKLYRYQEAPTQSTNGTRRSVLQDWVHQLTFMQQSVLMASVRGPDGIRKDHPVKVLCRYLRRSFLICAFDGKVRWSPYEPGGGSFTGPLNLHGTGEGEGHLDKYIEIYLRHVDEIAHHYQLHFMHAAEILGYKHPDSDVRGFWRAMYFAIVNDAHLRPEPEEVMDKRLGDVESQWRAAEVVTAQ